MCFVWLPLLDPFRIKDPTKSVDPADLTRTSLSITTRRQSREEVEVIRVAVFTFPRSTRSGDFRLATVKAAILVIALYSSI